jgi:hypothetical protein
MWISFFEDLRREKRLSNENILRKLQQARDTEVAEGIDADVGRLAP